MQPIDTVLCSVQTGSPQKCGASESSRRLMIEASKQGQKSAQHKTAQRKQAQRKATAHSYGVQR